MDAWVALFILLLVTWVVTAAAFGYLYVQLAEKFQQHTATARRLQEGLADVEDDLTRPPSKRGRA